MARGRLTRFLWRLGDDLDYFLTLARLRIRDVLAGPEAETPAVPGSSVGAVTTSRR